MKDSKTFRLDRVVGGEGAEFIYEYDFGDFWEHEILVENILPAEEGSHYPICLKGKRTCAPEDCGGVRGYAELLEILQNPEHEEHEYMMEWVGGPFEPEAFDLDEINQGLKHFQEGFLRL